MQITNVVCPSSKYSIKCPDVTKKEGVCVHNTANDATAMAEISYMLGRPDKVSFHAAVDDIRVVTGLSFDRSCFAASDGRYGKGNAHMINIEICYSKSGGKRFEEAEELASEYIAYLLKQNNWGIDKVTKHQDYGNHKYCPHRTLDLGWQRFLDKIKKYLDIQNEPKKEEKIEKGSDEKVRTYQNGSTSEVVYSDSKCTNKIGSLDPRETCDCFGIFNGVAQVRYKINGTNNYKMGFVKYIPKSLQA